ncbi:conserved hypothetical protein [Talaromyces stipitatus ATCC 10500]|uniref:Uncharacterized protein n=1 Tax=Talaromyces stipitatus (strain ATCC 10500 / CBS 375.48 / QM 6759 / NRRL 1006) TaxID=441959 RepID=B8M9J2_TALSN|nr:uncharacterized protein TSTA_117690 [Talaromyces stipitatus ATCC 10500]EED17994.1 conserved hypothetical protein [Talaromyces stipitatus ATCC 10500]
MAARVQMQQGNNPTDYRMYQVPSRRPVGATHHAGLQFQQPPETPSPQQRVAPNFDHLQSHSRTRTTSSTVLPYVGNSQHIRHQHQQHHIFHRQPHQRAQPASTAGPVPTRSSSSATTSTSSTSGNHQRLTHTMSTMSSSDIHRSSSSRSTTAPLSYVALMRRQKGTVWCDRAQPEDPRLQAQKRAAKQRAGKAAPGYSPSTLVGAIVPPRLSANEIGDDEEDDRSSEGAPYHRRTGSARSSLGSMHRYPSGYQRPQGKTPPNEQANIPEVVENSASAAHPDKAQIPQDTINTNSSSSSQMDLPTEDHEGENDFGSLGEMGAPAAANITMNKAKKADDLRRRGSVDDRTTSLTGVRLFVANPDADD